MAQSVSSQDRWRGFLSEYHREHAGITEVLLDRSTDPSVGTPYEWMRAAAGDAPGRVVDLACGSAPMHRYFSGATSYVGIDVCASELSVARERGRGPLVEADVCDLPLADGSAEVITCSMAVMLLDPIQRALSEIARVLKPGGQFICTRPVTFPIRVRDVRVGVALFRGLRQMPDLPQRLTRNRLKRLMADAGLRVVDDRALRFAHPLHSEDDAARIVEGLYLPTVSPARRNAGVAMLSGLADPHREVPVSIRRTVALRQ